MDMITGIKIFAGVFGVGAYIAVYFSCLDIDTSENYKHHEGGFLGMGYTTNSNRKGTVADKRKALFWPVLLVWWFLKVTIASLPLYLLSFLIGVCYTIVGVDYEESTTYKLFEAAQNKIIT